MTIRITLPGGIQIETDTLSESLAIAKALAPSEAQALPETEVKPPRTVRRATNGDLIVLDTWGLTTEEALQGMSTEDWVVVAGELQRSEAAARNLARRYVQGVYECSGDDPTAKVTIHPERDYTRPRPPVPLAVR